MAFSRARDYELIMNQLALEARAISHPARIQILVQLAGGERTLAEMLQDHPVSRQTLSGHLTDLIRAGLVYVEDYRSAALYGTDSSRWPLQVRVVVGEVRRGLSFRAAA